MSDPQWYIDAKREGRITEGPTLADRMAKSTASVEYALTDEGSAPLIVPTFRASFLSPVWEIPLLTRGEANQMTGWRPKARRTSAAWRAVSKAFGPHLAYVAPFAVAYHAGKVVRVCLTRIGGRSLDNGVNLPSSLKAVEDAVAWVMGADDGSPNWSASFAQEPGPAYGVRVELRK